jgi:serine/threonine protein kinase/Tol biopolymer transport system component
LIGSTISRYQILEQLGAGTLGTVVRARDLDLERDVVLRLLPDALFPGPEEREHAIADLTTVGGLDHPNVCAVWDVGEIEQDSPEGDVFSGVFVAMALAEGETLQERLLRGPLRPATAVSLGSQAAAGLARAHAAGIVHGNLRPANVSVSVDGQARILDLGLAELRPWATVAADLRALGALLFEMVTGRRPPDVGPAPPLRELCFEAPAELERIVESALSTKSGDRFTSAEEIRQALRSLRGSGTRPTLVPFSDHPTLRDTPTSGIEAADAGAPLHPFPGSGPRLPREVGHYRLREQTGGGGMGIIYKAEDTRLGRTVALKFLPPELTRDPVAKARFSQEARAVSALDHPNVCTIYDVGETEDVALYIAMPWYEGGTLRDRLEEGALPVDQAIDFARQIARGLGKAHRQGIVHRDVKPANLMVTPDDVVKIVDFGIAKLAGAAGITRTGVALGTPAYMAPEQVQGADTDHRADLWALGVVLYEMLAGRRPFPDGHEVVAFQAILFQEPPPLRELRPEVPPELERIVSCLLRKKPEERPASAEAVLEELRIFGGVSHTSVAGPPTVAVTVSPARRRRWLPWAAGLGLLLLAAVAWWLWPGRERNAGAPPPPSAFQRLTNTRGVESFPNASPIGDRFAFAGNTDGDWNVYLQRIVGGSNPINLTEDSPGADTQPAFSPDGERIAFRSARDGGGIFLMGATGESPRRLLGFGYNPAWSPDGKTIVCATEEVIGPGGRASRSELWLVDVESSRPKRLETGGDAVQPSWSPNGRRIAYWGIVPATSRRVIWTVAAEGGEGGEPVPVTDDAFLNWSPVWSPDGRYLYYASDRSGSMNLWRIRIDEDSGKVRVVPEPLTAPASWTGPLTLSRDGRHILYAILEERSNLARVPLDPATGSIVGPLEPVTEGSRSIRSGRISPDGQWLAFRTTAPQEDLFVIQPDGTGIRQLTNDPFRDRGPSWLPDGRIVFFSDRSGRYEVWAIHPDGSGLEQLTSTQGEPIFSPLGAPDGRRLVCGIGFNRLGLVDLSLPLDRRSPQPLPPPAGGSFFANSWSPDGARLAGVIQEGNLALFSFATRRYEDLGIPGYEPIWMPDGRRLVFLRDGSVRSLDLRTRQETEVFVPPPGSTFSALDLSSDGRILYLVRETEEGDIGMATMQSPAP